MKLGFQAEGALPVVLAGFDGVTGLVPVAGFGAVAGLLTAGGFGFCVCACAKPGAIARITAAHHNRATFAIGQDFIAALTLPGCLAEMI
ncbi:MAG: hypothetical protein WBE97_16045 [Candidatus Acidiferrales bacterium]